LLDEEALRLRALACLPLDPLLLLELLLFVDRERPLFVPELVVAISPPGSCSVESPLRPRAATAGM
jgi:hypothetical protein